MNKTTIRKALKPISHTLHKSHDNPQPVVIGSLTITGSRLYNAKGCVGPVWSPHYSATVNGQVMMTGNMDQIVDNIHRALNNPDWFAEHCRTLWGDRLIKVA